MVCSVRQRKEEAVGQMFRKAEPRIVSHRDKRTDWGEGEQLHCAAPSSIATHVPVLRRVSCFNALLPLS